MAKCPRNIFAVEGPKDNRASIVEQHDWEQWFLDLLLDSSPLMQASASSRQPLRYATSALCVIANLSQLLLGGPSSMLAVLCASWIVSITACLARTFVFRTLSVQLMLFHCTGHRLWHSAFTITFPDILLSMQEHVLDLCQTVVHPGGRSCGS